MNFQAPATGFSFVEGHRPMPNLQVNASTEVEELKGKPFLQDTLHIFESLSYWIPPLFIKRESRQFPTQTAHWGAQGENSSIITMGAIWGRLYKNLYFHTKHSKMWGWKQFTHSYKKQKILASQGPATSVASHIVKPEPEKGWKSSYSVI